MGWTLCSLSSGLAWKSWAQIQITMVLTARLYETIANSMIRAPTPAPPPPSNALRNYPKAFQSGMIQVSCKQAQWYSIDAQQSCWDEASLHTLPAHLCICTPVHSPHAKRSLRRGNEGPGGQQHGRLLRLGAPTWRDGLLLTESWRHGSRRFAYMRMYICNTNMCKRVRHRPRVSSASCSDMVSRAVNLHPAPRTEPLHEKSASGSTTGATAREVCRRGVEV